MGNPDARNFRWLAPFFLIINVLILVALCIVGLGLLLNPSEGHAVFYGLVLAWLAVFVAYIYEGVLGKVERLEKEFNLSVKIMTSHVAVAQYVYESDGGILWLIVSIVFYAAYSGRSLIFGDFYMLNTGIFHGLLVIPIVILLKIRRRTLAYFGIRKGKRLTWMALGLIAFVMGLFVRLLWLGGSFRDLAVLPALELLIVVPVTEELFFRGFLQTGLPKRLGWWAVPCSSLLFALSHIPKAVLYNSTTMNMFSLIPWSAVSKYGFFGAHDIPGYITGIFVMGLALGVLFKETESLISPTAMHILYNLTQFMR